MRIQTTGSWTLKIDYERNRVGSGVGMGMCMGESIGELGFVPLHFLRNLRAAATYSTQQEEYIQK